MSDDSGNEQYRDEQRDERQSIVTSSGDSTSRGAGVTQNQSVENVPYGNRQQAPRTSGQQSDVVSGQGGSGGYSWSERGDQQPEPSNFPQGGYNDSIYNQPGTYSQSDDSSGSQQDGYLETQGSGYGQSHNAPAQDQETVQAQEGYDPTHSGVRQAHNKPGTRVDAPGRETGTAWGEDQQMGLSTDTSNRRNPAQ